MNEKILEIIFDYSYNNKLLTEENGIEKIVEIAVGYNNLSSYVKEVTVQENSSKIYDDKFIRTATYNNKKIQFYIDGLNKYVNKMSRIYLLYTSNDIMLYRNLIITRTILHELEHSNQKKIIDNEQNLESDILKLQSEFTWEFIYDELLKSNCLPNETTQKLAQKIFIKVYQDVYFLDPAERLANIKASKIILQILSLLDYNNDILIKLLEDSFKNYLLRGYEELDGKIVPPTPEYFRLIGKKEKLNKFLWYNEEHAKCLKLTKEKYSLDKRLLYGLPITDKEFLINCQSMR